MMSYKLAMHPAVSKAEIEVFKELSRLHLTATLVTQKPIVLRQTIPDFWWISKRKVVYLDGEQAHRGREELDDEIKEMLESKGFSVLRIRYKPPLVRGSSQFKQVITEIKMFLGDDV
jgi:very-short-patch-repair endonuclease